jgi:crotonobetainyl-CoA:carnitine CoA-transferase CaiB-like acyl-CoA transferase
LLGDRPGSAGRGVQARGILPTRTGLMYLSLLEPHHWESLRAKVPELAARFPELDVRIADEHKVEVDAILRRWLKPMDRGDVVADLQNNHVPTAPILRPAEVLEDAQLRTREFFSSAGAAPGFAAPWIYAPVANDPLGG